MSTPYLRQTIAAWVITLFAALLFVSGCTMLTPAPPAGPFPTPTPFPLRSGRSLATPLSELVNDVVVDEPVLQSTVEAVDLDQMIAAQEAREEQERLSKLEQPISIVVDAAADQRPISPLVYGVANPPGIYLRTLKPTLSSWGGEGAVRFNWINGNSWNLGAPNTYRNSPVSEEGGGSRALIFLENAASAGAETYMVLPTIGWVAKNNSPDTCAFQADDGTCTSGNASTCQSNDVIGDPFATSRQVTPEEVLSFVETLLNHEAPPKILALTHEPELWGITHYDIHPNCTTYREIVDTYVRYAVPIKDAFPETELAGPGTCCWFFYFNSAAGDADKQQNGGQDFLPWFLDQMAAHEADTGQRLLDVLDIHYFPEHINSDLDGGLTGDLRLRAARSLWDPSYLDESWIREPVALVPRMLGMIEDHYPGTKLAISEWNFGADDTVNGGLAIADVLGVLGREGVYMASYEGYPAFRSPGFWAFKMFTNYNNLGSRFGDLSVAASSNDVDVVSTYAALNSETGNLHLIIINKAEGFEAKTISVAVNNFTYEGRVTRFQYDGNPDDPGSERIESSFISPSGTTFNLAVSPTSITHLVFPAPAKGGQPEQ